jgi:predicted ATPase/class 3 adenylate cyclase
VNTSEVTLLFTDIEGSTQLWERHPTAMAVALQRHDAMLRALFQSLDGDVFKTVGDALCVAFTSPKSALLGAAAAQRLLAGEQWDGDLHIRVRMGLHTGACELRNGDYFGPTVNRVARLEATAHGGQVVMSAATAALIREDLPPGTTLRALGSHLLRDLGEREDVFQLEFEDLESEFPPLRSVVGPVDRTNLPASRGTFIGREGEMAELQQQVGLHRLVTLIGPGGTGKTSLAIETGRRMTNEETDGVWLVELGGISDDSLLTAVTIRTLGLAGEGPRDDVDQLCIGLRGQHRLLIFDNCEHLLRAAALLIDTLLSRCEGVRVIATSREALHLDGELQLSVPALSVPSEPVTTLEDALRFDAVALLVDRVRAQVSGIEISDGDVPSIISICHRLDGIPLALELAAPRLRSLTFGDVDERLDQRFKLLTQGVAGRLERQQTLDSLVRWSYDLLEGPERDVFRRLSVFQSGFSLTAAESVCESDDLTDALGSLVDKSMVTATRVDGAVRYTMLQTIREFGWLRAVEESPPVDAVGVGIDVVQQRHADYFTDLASTFLARNRGPTAPSVYAATLNERDNYLAAAEWLVTQGPRTTPRAWQLFRGMAPMVESFGRSANLLDLVDRSLDVAPTTETMANRGGTLYLKARLHEFYGQYGDTLAALSDSLHHGRESGDLWLEALAESTLAAYTQSAENAQHAVQIAQELPDPWMRLVTVGNLGIALLSTDSGRAYEYLGEAQAIAREEQFNLSQLILSEMMCLGSLADEDLDSARRYVDAGLEVAAQGYAKNSRAHNLRALNGWVLLAEGSPERARVELAAAFVRARISGNTPVLKSSLLGSACCYASLGELDLAAELFDVSETLPGIELAYQRGVIANEKLRCTELVHRRVHPAVLGHAAHPDAGDLDRLEHDLVAAANR